MAPGFPPGGAADAKVFVGGLSWQTRSEGLRRHFERYGEIVEAVVISDKRTGRSKGYGFVTFRGPESARSACGDPSPVIDGRKTNCNIAALGRWRGVALDASSVSAFPFAGGILGPGAAYVGIPAYHYPFPVPYHQAFPYAYEYMAYGHGSGPSQQHIPIHRVSEPGNPRIYLHSYQPVFSGRGFQAHTSSASQHFMQSSRSSPTELTPVSLDPPQAMAFPDFISSLSPLKPPAATQFFHVNGAETMTDLRSHDSS